MPTDRRRQHTAVPQATPNRLVELAHATRLAIPQLRRPGIRRDAVAELVGQALDVVFDPRGSVANARAEHLRNCHGPDEAIAQLSDQSTARRS